MLHAYVRRFDVMGTVEFFLKTKQAGRKLENSKKTEGDLFFRWKKKLKETGELFSLLHL